jgi:pimeloyl-ACP methyl ester carboxylesterase
MKRFVDVPGSRIAARSQGDGPPIVLIHAAIGDMRSWDAMVPGLAKAGYRAIRYDCRGFGETKTDDIAFSPRSDLLAVLDAFGIERAALVGNSAGGGIALDTAVEFPDRVVAVIGVGSSLNGFNAPGTPQEQALFTEWARLASTPGLDREKVVELGVRVWVDGPGQSPYRVDDAIHDAVREMFRPLLRPEHVGGRAVPLDPTANDSLAHLRCPVLAVAGALDVSTVPTTARRLETGAPNAQAVILPNVAHMIGMEAPDRLNELIVDFLAPLRPWA